MTQSNENYRMPFEESWSELPESVKTHVRMTIIMVGIFMFAAGVFFGVML